MESAVAGERLFEAGEALGLPCWCLADAVNCVAIGGMRWEQLRQSASEHTVEPEVASPLSPRELEGCCLGWIVHISSSHAAEAMLGYSEVTNGAQGAILSTRGRDRAEQKAGSETGVATSDAGGSLLASWVQSFDR